MIQEALKYLKDHLGQGRVFTFESNEREVAYFDREVHPCPLPTAPPLPMPVELSTLSGLARFAGANIDGLDLSSHLFYATADRVSLLGPLSARHRQRETIAVANYRSGADEFIDGSLIPLEDLLVGLETHFEPNEGRAKLITLLGDVDVTDAEKRVKQGMGYQVKINRGVGGAGWEDVIEPFELRPYRAFPEAGAQVASKFILDLNVQRTEDRTAVSVRLREVDGKAWIPKAAEAVGRALLREVAFLNIDEPYVIW